MERHNEEYGTLGVAQANMAAALASDLPAESFQGANKLRTGDDR
jgi:hypothetical protein